jgi:hypothetical protein
MALAVYVFAENEWFAEGKGKRFWKTAVVVVVFLKLFNIYVQKVEYDPDRDRYLQVKKEVEEDFEKVKDYFDMGKVYVVTCDDGLRLLYVNYIIVPKSAGNVGNYDGWPSVGGGDLRKTFSREQWVQYVLEGGFDYIYLCHIDDDFIRDYGELIGSGLENGVMYKVVREGDYLDGEGG